ncbi:GtrA family protein [Streptomyces sp. enrichment culture]|uniref:GtrA family protein n=1 Tax=Streptomyces sp. enrichment culture TaxID=1795815 RepID=UPI003F57F25B
MAAGGRRELLGFAAAGLLAYAVDLGLFTWLRGPAGLGPLTAKALSFVAGCSVAYAGNALGTYRHVRPRGVRPYAVFFAVNAAGAAVQLLCLAVSHYGLGLTSQRADTVSGAGVGMALGTVLRFWGTRTLVFTAGNGTSTGTGVGNGISTGGGSGDPTRSWNTTSGGRVGSWTG